MNNVPSTDSVGYGQAEAHNDGEIFFNRMEFVLQERHMQNAGQL